MVERCNILNESQLKAEAVVGLMSASGATADRPLLGSAIVAQNGEKWGESRRCGLVAGCQKKAGAGGIPAGLSFACDGALAKPVL
jgi:hypothetical protein